MSAREYHGSRRIDALGAWIYEAITYGPRGCGVVFVPSFTDLDRYMREIESMGNMPVLHKSRSSRDVVTYGTMGGAVLTLMPMWTLSNLVFACGSHWPFMMFHDPMQWPDPTFFASLRRQLKPTYRDRTTLITIESKFPAGYDTGSPAESLTVSEQKPREIDYLEITRNLSAK